MNHHLAHIASIVLFVASPAVAQNCPGDDLFEPNDSCVSAVPLAEGTHPNLVMLADDDDMWQVVVPPGGDIVVDLLFTTATGNIDVKLVTGDCNSAIDYGQSVTDNEQVTGHNASALPEVWLVHAFAAGSSFTCTDYTIVVTTSGLSTSYCWGDGSSTACPCGNPGASGEGCANSTGAGGMLGSTGSGSVSVDDLRFDAAQLLPSQPALLFSGQNAVGGGSGVIFGDGLRCAGQNVVRLGVQTPDAQGQATWGPGLASSGGWIAGDKRFLQVWYRDPLGSPCGSNFNLSNGLEVDFVP